MVKVIINKENFKINDGKEFDLPEMTVKKQREILESLSKEQDKITQQEYNKELQRRMILKSLQEVDSDITIDEIEAGLHPSEFIALADAVWEAGKATEKEGKFRIKR